jgi:hypothetical protein
MTAYPFDPALVLEDGSTAVTATRFGQVAGAARVYDFGTGGVEWIGYVVATVSALDLTSGNETYTIGLQLSASAAFTSPADTAALALTAVTGADAAALLLSNKVGGTVYRYGRLRITAAGTTPSVRLSSFLAKQTAVDQLSFAQLVAEFQALLAEWEAAGGGAGESVTTYELSAHGVDTSGVTGGQKAAVEAARDDVLDDYANTVGRTLIGTGILRVDATLNYLHAASYMPTLRHQAQFGFTGTMIQVGRYGATFDNTRRTVPTHVNLLAWGGNPTVGKQSAITAFELNDEICPGSRYRLFGAYVGVVAHVNGNFEKQRVEISGADSGTVLKLSHIGRPPPGGVGPPESVSTDSCVFLVTATNSNRLAEILDERVTEGDGAGSDISAIIDYVCEAAQPTNPPTPLVHDQNDKFIRHRGMVRGMKGQGGSDGFLHDMPRNDGCDSVLNDVSFTTAGGRAFDFAAGRNLMGRPIVRAGTDAGRWNAVTGTVDDTRDVPVETFLIGQWISGGAFCPVNVSGTADRGIQYGSDDRWSIGTSFGDFVSSMGTYFDVDGLGNRPKQNVRPRNRVAGRFYKGENCYYSNREAHGRLIWYKGLFECTTRATSPHVQDAYPCEIEPGGSWTHIYDGGVTLAQAVNSGVIKAGPSGDQVVRFESISDLDGMAVTFKNGLWSLEGQHRVSTLALAAQESDLNRYFRRTGLMVSPETGGRPGEPFAAQTGGSWRSIVGGASIVPGEMAATTAMIARLAAAPSTAYRRIYDRLLYRLSEIDCIPAGISGWLLGMETQAASKKALFPANGGSTWYDLTESGAPGWVQKQGFAMNPTNLDKLATGYDMTAAAEGAGLNDFLCVVGARRDTPAYTGSDNVFDLTSVNGKAKLRDRDNAEQLSIGTTATTAFPAGTSRMPDLVMAGRVDAATQFGVSGGRIVVQGAVSSAGGAGGMPDAISLGGSRELWCAAMFKASYFFTSSGGVVSPIGDRALVLHRAFTEALASLEAL